MNRKFVLRVIASCLLAMAALSMLAGCLNSGTKSGSSKKEEVPAQLDVSTLITPGLFEGSVTFLREDGGEPFEDGVMFALSPSGKFVLFGEELLMGGRISVHGDSELIISDAILHLGDDGVQNPLATFATPLIEIKDLNEFSLFFDLSFEDDSGNEQKYSVKVEVQRNSEASDSGIKAESIYKTHTLEDSRHSRIALTITEDGTLTVGDDTGCVGNGTLAIPDETINIAELSINLENCGDVDEEFPASYRNGQFQALTTLQPPGFSGVNLIVLGYSESARLIWAQLEMVPGDNNEEPF